MPSLALFLLVLIVAIGLVFDFINGFHDTANAIATSIATRVLKPGTAVLMAGVLNCCGCLNWHCCRYHYWQRHRAPTVVTQLLVISALLSRLGYLLPPSPGHRL